MPAARLAFPGPIAIGSDGCDSTGATTEGSVIIARAKLPVKHMPTAPTPRPPHSAWTCRASARSQSTIGLERSLAQTSNSRRMQMPFSMVPSAFSGRISFPASPNRCGQNTVIPAAAMREAKRSTCGCRPGISWITITAGPFPRR